VSKKATLLMTSRAAFAHIQESDERRRGLRRMRTIATLLLILMIALYVLTAASETRWPWLAYVRAFAEAGMIGACADWFAVVALFRHPLGIPIPHTAIIPNNKARIGPALGRFITNNFLDVRVPMNGLPKSISSASSQYG
jgi:uncharacterized membrane-anchored protein YjiN (DUF445 family)